MGSRGRGTKEPWRNLRIREYWFICDPGSAGSPPCPPPRVPPPPPSDDDDDDGDDDHHHHHHELKHLKVSLAGRRVSSAHVPGNDYRFIDRRAAIFVTVAALGAIAIRLQSANCHRDRACHGTRSS